jgi:uncharacterized membrane protein
MFVKLYSIAVLVFIAIDAVWLGLIAKNFYAKHIGSLLKQNVNFTAAIIFYLLFVVGLVIFVITPAIEKRSIQSVLLLGSLFGLITYATYDLTNLATLKDWPLVVTIVDLIWGAFISVSVSSITYLIYMRFFA